VSHGVVQYNLSNTLSFTISQQQITSSIENNSNLVFLLYFNFLHCFYKKKYMNISIQISNWI